MNSIHIVCLLLFLPSFICVHGHILDLVRDLIYRGRFPTRFFVYPVRKVILLGQAIVLESARFTVQGKTVVMRLVTIACSSNPFPGNAQEMLAGANRLLERLRRIAVQGGYGGTAELYRLKLAEDSTVDDLIEVFIDNERSQQLLTLENWASSKCSAFSSILINGPDGSLGPGAFLRSLNGKYDLIMEHSCNLALRTWLGEKTWESGTARVGGRSCILVVKGDSSLVIYEEMVLVWEVQFDCDGGKCLTDSSLLVENGGNLVLSNIFLTSTTTWSTKTT